MTRFATLLVILLLAGMLALLSRPEDPVRRRPAVDQKPRAPSRSEALESLPADERVEIETVVSDSPPMGPSAPGLPAPDEDGEAPSLLAPDPDGDDAAFARNSRLARLEVGLLRELTKRQPKVDVGDALLLARERVATGEPPLESALSYTRHGVLRTFYPDGALKSVTFFVDGIKTGREYQLWPDGTLKLNSYRDHGKKHGVEKAFDKHGHLVRESPYVKGKRHGLETLFYDTGLRKKVTRWDKGRRHGKEQEFHDNGVLKKILPWRRGVAQARALEFYENGQVRQVTPYEHGRPQGDQNEFWPGGGLKRTVWLERGKPLGVEYFYDKAGVETKRVEHDGRGGRRTLK